MDHIVNRESGAMKSFSSVSDGIADEMETVCTHLKQLISEAGSYMQDRSGQSAIRILEELVEETLQTMSRIRLLADRIKQSADLLEESDTLL